MQAWSLREFVGSNDRQLSRFHAAKPTASSRRFVIPQCCAMLAAIENGVAAAISQFKIRRASFVEIGTLYDAERDPLTGTFFTMLILVSLTGKGAGATCSFKDRS